MKCVVIGCALRGKVGDALCIIIGYAEGRIWAVLCCVNNRSISLSSKIWLMRSLVTSIFLYVCESWTLTAELQRRIQTMEMRCYRKILHISYKDHVTNEKVRAKIQQAIGPHEDLLMIVKSRKLQRYGHVPRSSGLAKTYHLARHSKRGKKTRWTEKDVGR